MAILKCDNLKKYFPIRRGYLRARAGSVKAVDGVSLEIERGSTFGLVGESGCGKTTLGYMVLGILKPDSGQIYLATNKIQAVFQDPYNSLDPRMRVLDILSEGLMLRKEPRDAIRPKVERVLDLVRLPKTALTRHPHQFSGGERQRIAIGRAVLTEPDFMVCDEPVSSLDMTVQLQILNLLKDIQKKFKVTYLFISHDLRVVRFMSDFIAVMREGKIVERAPAQRLYSNPSHQYTRQLLASVLDIYP